MKKIRTLTLVVLLVLTLSSGILTGCSGCGTQNDSNPNDMVEAPMEESSVAPSESSFADDALNNHDNGGNTNNTEISTSADDAIDNNVTDSNGNPVATEEGLIEDSGNMVGDALDNVGNAAADVVDGVGNGVKDLVQ